jgi:hypothetical protein
MIVRASGCKIYIFFLSLFLLSLRDLFNREDWFPAKCASCARCSTFSVKRVLRTRRSSPDSSTECAYYCAFLNFPSVSLIPYSQTLQSSPYFFSVACCHGCRYCLSFVLVLPLLLPLLSSSPSLSLLLLLVFCCCCCNLGPSFAGVSHHGRNGHDI